jgi:hypothetical protein
MSILFSIIAYSIAFLPVGYSQYRQDQVVLSDHDVW